MVTAVTNLGRSGLYDWLVQRATAVILLAYFLCIAGFMLTNPDFEYAQWHAYFNSTFMRIFSLLALISLVAHSWIMLKGVSVTAVTAVTAKNKRAPLQDDFRAK